MGKKAAKATRKFAASGQLKKSIDARRKHQQVKKQIERRKVGKGAGKHGGRSQGDAADDDGASSKEGMPKN
ncbi:hypothetical protein BKA70DRAFT_821427 [Coprinopsis sp. MPI-PUGE-AT-0042]|nr:hypothetical protein BKA70DRAFT_821427 [Coprinopsis sp. MPI-PUGE-AT-0042]